MITYVVAPPVDNAALNQLFMAAWPTHRSHDFAPILGRSLTYVCAFHADHLIGFVNLAWDGGVHAFVLDTTVHPEHRRRGIGVQLVRRAASVAADRGIEWLHVDFEPHLRSFYEQCGFQPTQAGLMRVASPDQIT